MLDRRGKIFADHYHLRILRTPTEVVRAIRYVLDNGIRHYGADDRSWSSRAPDAIRLLVHPRSWLLRIGWERTSDRDRIMPTLRRLSALPDA